MNYSFRRFKYLNKINLLCSQVYALKHQETSIQTENKLLRTQIKELKHQETSIQTENKLLRTQIKELKRNVYNILT